MTISYEWLCEYLPTKPEPEVLSHILTSVGLEVESMERKEFIKGSLDGLVIGKVISCIQHPNADKLKCTMVDVGEASLLNIVCGAPNVAVGQTVVIAKIGSFVHPLHGEAFEIKKAKIRGEMSEGMICAEDEIGLGESHDGIMILDDAMQAGALAKIVFNIPEPEIVYEIGLTPNRMDAMSHLGVAKDVCAYLGNLNNELCISKIPKAAIGISSDKLQIEVSIEDNQRCARYAGLCIENIRVADSPEWLKSRLLAIGLRPINNIVDITNFVLHECGQPLHAFDMQAIKGNKIIIKTVADQTKFMCLDGKERILQASDLMICNESEPMCIAGVFGGLDSGVTASTQSIFLESAWFDNHAIRLTSVHHGLRTDAATRFEKGADISNVIFALQRAAHLICEVSGGNIASSLIDSYPTPFEPKQIELSYEKTRKLAGKNYPVAQIKNILNHLCFSILHEDEKSLSVQVPFAKPDITMQADLVEEIMRIDGLDNVPFTGKISFALPEKTAGYMPDVKNQLAQLLVGKGFKELFTNSISNSAFYPERDDLVIMMNSLSAELDTMRPSMLETGLVAINYNLNRKNVQLKFFEFGKTYHKDQTKFIEEEKLCLYVSGNYHLENWSEKTKSTDIYFVKGIVENLLSAMKPTFEKGETALNIRFQNTLLGHIELVSNEKLKAFDIKQAVWYVELSWITIKNFYQQQKLQFKTIPKFPLVQRDLSLVLERKITYSDVQLTVKKAKSKLLQSIHLFDVFESEKMGADKKSYAINLAFYDKTKTLTDPEVDAEMQLIIESLESKLGATIRK